MTNLEQLIQELCSNGVEYKKLGEVATISRGGSFQKKDYVEKGVPCIHYGQIYMHYDLFVEQTISYISEEIAQKQRFAESNDIIMAVTSENIDDVCKCVAWLGNGKVAVSGHTAIIHHSLHPKYLVYFLHSSTFYQQKTKIAHGTKVIEVSPNKLNDIIIPVPPPPVQHEIVRILDNFTELTAELTAELAARKKQYEYFEYKLLFDNDYQRAKLQELCTVNQGLQVAISKRFKEPAPNRYMYITVQFLKNKDDDQYYIENPDEQVICRKDDILVTRTGSTGVIVSGVEGCFHNNFFKVNCNDNIDKKYMLCLLRSKFMYNKMLAAASGGNVQDLPHKKFYNLEVPLPSIDRQKQIVDILDRFDTLCNDISNGLPAEIEARQKQYEYYRDKLLTFKEIQK